MILALILWLWLQLMLAGWLLRRAQKDLAPKFFQFDPISLAIYVGITLITTSIQARMNRKSLKDFTGIPTIDETRPIPYIAGSVELSAPALLNFGDFHRSKVTLVDHLPGFLFFLAPIVAILNLMPIGYRYYCGFDFGLCHGSNVTLKGIKIADYQVYSGSLAGGTGVVAAPGIFGLEGGTYAVFDFYTGSLAQLANPYWKGQAGTNPNAIATTTLNAGGSGYLAGDTGSIDGGTTHADYLIVSVDGLGAVVTYNITGGTGYGDSTGITTTRGFNQPGVGTGFKINITSVTPGGGRVPGYRGVSHLVWRGPSSGDPGLGDIKFSGYVGRTPSLKEFKFQLTRIPDNLGASSFATINGNEANPAEILYELFTNESLGIGAPPSTFDLAAWQAAAETLYDEGLGCSLTWDNSSTVGDVINHLRDTVDCVIFSSLDGVNAGKLTVKLIRDDYILGDLIEVTPSNASDVVKFTNRTVDDVPNEIKVEYIDINAGYVKGEAIWQSLANRQLGETRSTITTDYPIGNAVTASKLATRDGISMVLPIKDVQLKANRQTSRLTPGSVFKFTWPEYDVEQIILRIANITLGNLDDPTVILECVEDRFSLGESAFGTVSTRLWTNPTSPEPQDNLIHTIINQTTTVPPSTPAVGDSYIVAAGASGAWSGMDGSLATWTQAGAWQFTSTSDLTYTVVYDASTQTLVGHDGTGWSTIVTTAYNLIQDEGAPLTRRSILNFIGHGVAATDDSGNVRTNVTVTAYDTVQDEGSALTQRPILDFAGAGVTATDDSGGNRTLVTIPGAPTAAPVDATYITQTPNATLTNEQAMSALTTGIVKNTTTTGVQSIADANDISSPVFAADAGSNDTYVATLSPVPSSYVTGTHYRFKANTANTGAATINFNSLGAKTIKKAAGGITTDLADNDIRAGQWVDLVYDGMNMQMQSTMGNAASGGVSGLTTGALSKATSSTTLGDSSLSQDSASNDLRIFGSGSGGVSAHFYFGVASLNTPSFYSPSALLLHLVNSAGSFCDFQANSLTAAGASDVGTAGVSLIRNTGMTVGRDVQWGFTDGYFSKGGTRHPGLLFLQGSSGGGAFVYPPTSPTQITADQNNYSLATTGRSYFIRLTSDATRNITGLVLAADSLSNNQQSGEEHLIVNVGANNIVLINESASSAAANRFHNSTGADITLAPDQAADILYDGTTQRWRVFKRN